MNRHHLPDTEDGTYPIGTVWLSRWSNSWLRQVGRARWRKEIIATDEEVFALHGRRYPQ